MSTAIDQIDTLETPKGIIDTTIYEGNIFRNSNGNHRTLSLFYELVGADKSTVVYTLKDIDHKGFPSLKRLYLELGDSTEYKFATTYLDGWEHWKKISGTEWFKPLITQWREELRVKKEYEYVAKLEEIAASEKKEGTSAIKTLLERNKKPTESSKRGRPVHPYREESKTSVGASKAQETLNDLKRLGLA